MKEHEVLTTLKRQHRRRSLTPVLLTLLLGGLITALATILAAPAQPFWEPSPLKAALWAGLLGVTALLALVLGLKSRRDLARTAADLDAQLASKNRLEAAAELAHDNSAVAAAQREESREFLQQAKTRKGPWFALLATGAVVILLLQGALMLTWLGIVAGRGWHWDKPVVVEEKPPQARFTWIKPEAEIKASPLEEVPLTAQAESTSGLEKVTLEISVNGGLKTKSVPVDVAALTKPGETPLDLSLYMDEIEVEPFDIVSYYLSGQRVSKVSLPAVASDMQFVQVRPLRDDALQGDPGFGEGSPCLKLLLKLKLAQLGLLKQNHLLSNAEIPKTEKVWTDENTRVGSEQKTLSEKTTEGVQFCIDNGAPVQVVDWLKEAQPLMVEAAQKIAETKNATATPDQQKALSLIIACEKLFVKVLVKGNKPGKPDIKDPFADKQRYELTKRSENPMGQLEELAKEQEKATKEMSQPQDASSPSPGNTEREQKLAAQEKALAEKLKELQPKLSPEAGPGLSAAEKKAQEAAAHLEAKDPQAAGAAAAEALSQLQNTVAGLQQRGEDKAAAALSDAQRELNRASDLARQAEQGQGKDKAQSAAEKVAGTREALKAEAERQQAGGSEQAAKTLAELVNDLQKPDLNKQLKTLAEGGKPEDAASQAQGEKGEKGEASKPASDKLAALAQRAGVQSLARLARDEARSKTAESIRSLQRNLERLAKKNGGAGDAATKEEVLESLRDQVQRAETMVRLPFDPNTPADLRHLIDGSLDPQNGATSIVVVYETLKDPLNSMLEVLRQANEGGSEREAVIAVANEEEIPLPYREPVARYFEELSRKSARPTAVEPSR